jgi:hypothetical protein
MRQRILLPLLSLTVLVVPIVGGIRPDRANADIDPSSQFFVLARADAFALEYLNTGAPVFGSEPVIYGTPSTAQSLLDSVGRSTSFASAPYPGEIMVGLPSNGNGAAGGFGFPGVFPAYPFYVQSDYPGKKDAVQDQSGNSLRAHSEQYGSASEARSGPIAGDLLAALQSRAATAVAVDPDTGIVTARADSRFDGFKLGEDFQVGKSSSFARITKKPGQSVERESAFTLASIKVKGVEVAVNDKGLQIGDQQPSKVAPPGEFGELLKQAGVTIEYLPATTTDSSVDSAGMRITQVQQLGDQTQRVSITLGRVSARIDGSVSTLTANSGLDSVGSTRSDEELAKPQSETPVASSEVETIPEPSFAEQPQLSSDIAFSSDPASLSTAPVTPPVASIPSAAVSREALFGTPAREWRLRDDRFSRLFPAGLLAAAVMALGWLRLPRKATGKVRSVLQLPTSPDSGRRAAQLEQ